MKSKLLIFLGLVLCSQLITAQSYELINPERASFFVDHYNQEVVAIKADTAYQTPDGLMSELHKGFKNVSNCILPIEPTWFGSRCLKKGNSLYTFYNYLDDPIIIDTKDSIGNSWHLYDKPNGAYFLATLDSIEPEIILGAIDTIMYISIQYYYDTGLPVFNLANNISLKIGKSNGFINTFFMKYFPNTIKQCELIGMSNPDIGSVYLTKREIYDFNVGDIFHYTYVNTSAYNELLENTLTIREIIDKQFFNNGDSVVYLFKDSLHSYISPHYTNGDTIVSKTELVTKSYSFKENQKMLPNGASNIDGFGWQCFWRFSDYHEQRRVLIMNDTPFAQYDGDSCWHMLCGPDVTAYYLEGCGLYKRDHNHEGLTIFTDLVYYKKGTFIWGTPISMPLAIDEIKQGTTELNIYPNPVKRQQKLNIRTKHGESYQISIYSLQGQLIYAGVNEGSEIAINTAELSRGVYIVEALSVKQSIRQKIIVE